MPVCSSLRDYLFDACAPGTLLHQVSDAKGDEYTDKLMQLHPYEEMNIFSDAKSANDLINEYINEGIELIHNSINIEEVMFALSICHAGHVSRACLYTYAYNKDIENETVSKLTDIYTMIINHCSKKNIEIPTDLALDAYIENLKDTLQGCIERAKEQSIRDSDKRRGIYYLNKK